MEKNEGGCRVEIRKRREGGVCIGGWKEPVKGRRGLWN